MVWHTLALWTGKNDSHKCQPLFSHFPDGVDPLFPLLAYSLSIPDLTMGRKSISGISEIQGSKEQIDAVRALVDEFYIPGDQLRKISSNLVKQMEEGLKRNDTCVPMLPSWIVSHPTGQETGEYLALDLSGE
jgi:hypothetical protein